MNVRKIKVINAYSLRFCHRVAIPTDLLGTLGNVAVVVEGQVEDEDYRHGKTHHRDPEEYAQVSALLRFEAGEDGVRVVGVPHLNGYVIESYHCTGRGIVL